MSRSFILQVKHISNGKAPASAPSMILCYRFSKPKHGLVMSQYMPSLFLPKLPQNASEWLCPLVSFPKKGPVGEMLTVSSRQGKVSSRISQDHLRWRSVLGKGSFIQMITYSSSNVQGREPGQPQTETPTTGQCDQAPKQVGCSLSDET